MIKKISVFISLFVIVCAATAGRAGNYVFQLNLDIIESGTKPEKAALISQIDNINKRESGGKYKYIAGGKFTLSEGAEGIFETRQKDSTLSLIAGYRKYEKEYFGLSYDANLIFPFLESAFRFKNNLRIKPGETIITEETKLPQGIADTRPYWTVLRVVLLEPSYTEGSYGGIGAVLNVKDGYPYVQEVHAGSPAQSAGIKQGDNILQIDDIDVFGRNLQDVINLIRGKPNTPVKIKISRAGQFGEPVTKTITIERWILKQ